MSTKRDHLVARIEKFARNEGYGDNRAKGLEFYAARLFARDEQLASDILAGDPWDVADISTYVCGNSGDGGFDAILYSRDTNKVIAIQSKYRTKKWTNSELLDEIEKLKGHFEQLRDKNYRNSRLNGKTLELVEESEIYSKSKSVSLHLVTNQAIGDFQDCHRRCNTITEGFSAEGREVEILLLGAAELLEIEKQFEAAESARLVSSQTIQFASDSRFEYVSRDRRAIVGVLKGNAVAALFKQQGAALFNLNVRGFLGQNLINRGIIRTAQGDDADNFFYFNNGITATCSEIEDAERGAYMAHDLQIVNGAQTVKSLYRALKSQPNEDVKVLFRLIETGDRNRNKSRFANDIARFQNTQNKVVDSDFFSNDNIQVWIESNFSKKWSGAGVGSFIYPFYYQRKRDDTSTGPGKRITIQELGKLRHAFLHGPSVAYREARTLWSSDDNSRYWEAFGRKLEDGKWGSLDEWSDEELGEMAWAVYTWQYLHKQAAEKAKISRTHKNKTSGPSQAIPEENYLRNLSFWVVALVAVGIRERIRIGRIVDFTSIMRSEETWKNACDDLVKQARISLGRELLDLYNSGQANPRLNLPGNDRIWKKVTAEMEVAASV